jgi:imidazolonepropionase-like amidohydrolase
MTNVQGPRNAQGPISNSRGLIVVVLMLWALVLRAQQPGAIAVTHVSVIDGTGARTKADQTVLLRDGRIAAIGRAGRINVPEGTQIVDGKGRFLIPGLWGMHVHGTGMERFSELYIANGVTGIRDMFTPMPYIEAERKAIEKGNPGPHIMMH